MKNREENIFLKFMSQNIFYKEKESGEIFRKTKNLPRSTVETEDDLEAVNVDIASLPHTSNSTSLLQFLCW